ncbi:MAG: transcription termination/antitermination protein NusA [Bacillales bacterium]|nr:transcription termination/antitermination protein NusA [Bacillales bacterium]
MVSQEFFKALNEVCEERGLEKAKILEAMEKGIVNAFKKETGTENAKVVFSEDKNELNLVQYFNVVEDNELDPEDPSKITLEEAKKYRKTARVGDYFEIKKTPKDFGRIAVNSTKQILNQELKRLEREKSYAFFSEHQDEMITGTVINVGEDYISFDLGYNVSASLPKTEIAREDAHQGARVKLYLYKVEMTPKGPKVFVSRSDKNLIKRLLENYIPEVKDGTIEILGIAREPGDRSKICVMTNDPDVDPLGACLGPKGKRIKDVIDALGGEKLDLYEYSDDPKQLVINSLKPAEVIGVIFDQKAKQAVAIVPEDQFSLAIGKKGQNVRLAVQSSGWKIDIKSVPQALEEGFDF